MTGLLLAALARVRGRWWLQLLLCALALPLLPLTLFVDALGASLREWRIAAALGRGEVRCPRGHVVVLVDAHTAWTCSSCGYAYDGSGWARCPRCRSVAAYVACPCGLSVDNPVFDWVDDAR